MNKSSQKRKSERELMVFTEFAKCVGIAHASIQSKKQPEPDILCSFGGELVYFEVTMGTDQRAQKTMRDYDKSAALGFIGCKIDVFTGVCSAIRKKLAKARGYKTTEAKTIHLLVYMEFGMERSLMQKLECETSLMELVNHGLVQAIWFFDRNYPQAPVGRIDREPFRIHANPEYAGLDLRISAMHSSIE
jgi:hypothetical protein